nr:FtsX-like permease family protein [Stagnihabitans tardus]
MQLLTLLAGLALGTALWSGVQAINAEARASYDEAASALGAGLSELRGPITLETYVALRRAGWNVSPVIEGRLGGVRLLGIEPLTAPRGPVTQGADIASLITGGDQIFAREEVLARLPETGAKGVVAETPPDTALADIGLAQRLLGREGQIDRLIVAADQPLSRPPLTEVAPGLTLRAPSSGQDVARLTDSFHLNLTAFGLLSFAVGLFIVHGAIGLAFEQRRPMVRTLRALGAPLRGLVVLIAAELALLALVAGALGVVLGYLVAATLLPDVAATLRGLYGAEVSGALSLRPSWWLSGMAMALGGTAVAAGGALWSLARTPLLASAQPRAWVLARRGRWQLALSLALLALAGGLALWGQGLILGFVMLGALFIGGALALPTLLAGALGLGGARAKGPVAQWFWADTEQQLPGLSLALMALLLAMAANVGVSTMVSSFRTTFVAFLDQRLASELYVTATDATQASAIEAFAAPRTDAVLPILMTETRIKGLPATIYGARNHRTYRDNWRFLEAAPGVWESLARGEGLLVNEQLFRRAGLRLGAMVPVDETLSLPVLGIYGDYGNPVGQVVITETTFRQHFPQVTAQRFGLRLDPKGVPALRQSLREGLGLDDSAMIDQAGLKAMSLAVFERTFTVTAALNVLTLAVAGFAILMSLLTLAAMRLPQLAPVWALGLTRAQLARLEMARAMVLAALTGVLALPLGLALAWALLAVVNVEAFGWRLPLYLFPLDYLRLGLWALLAAGLAALWPAFRLSRMPPTALLGVFRHER